MRSKPLRRNSTRVEGREGENFVVAVNHVSKAGSRFTNYGVFEISVHSADSREALETERVRGYSYEAKEAFRAMCKKYDKEGRSYTYDSLEEDFIPMTPEEFARRIAQSSRFEEPSSAAQTTRG